MSSRKRKHSDEDGDDDGEAGGKGEIHQDSSETEGGDDDDDKDNNGGEGQGSSNNTNHTKNEKKKFRLQADEHVGTLLICGATNWDLIGRSELPKNAKGAGGRNLLSPNRLKALSGIKVRNVVTGCMSAHSVIITEEGKVMTWGRNDKGQLGHGDLKRRDVPTYIENLQHVRVVKAACGRSHTLVLTDHGHLYSFGDNKTGQCGTGPKQPSVSTPTQVSFKGRPITDIACGAEFSMMVDFKGFLFSCGSPQYGQLGHNSDGQYFVTASKLAYNCEVVPRRVGLFIEKTKEGHIIPIDEVQIISIACGPNHTVAMDNKKRCFTWGFGGYGRLGHSEPKDELIPRLVKFFDGPNRGVKSVYAGGMFGMAINEMGCLYFWGQNKCSGEATMYPKPINDLSGWNIRTVSCGHRSIFVLADESVISWGPSPMNGQLGYGDNKPKSSTIPQEVKPLDGIHVHSVSCGYEHTLFIARDDGPDDEKAKLNALTEYAP